MLKNTEVIFAASRSLYTLAAIIIKLKKTKNDMSIIKLKKKSYIPNSKVKKHRSYNLFHIISNQFSDRSYGSYMK